MNNPNGFVKGDKLRITEDYPYAANLTAGDIVTFDHVDDHYNLSVIGSDGTKWLIDSRHAEIVMHTSFNHDYARGGKIQAIKALREFIPSLSLKEAKDIVDSIAAGCVGYDAIPAAAQARIDDLNNRANRLERDMDDLHAKIAQRDDMIRRMARMLTADQLVILLMEK